MADATVDDQQVARFIELTHATPEQALFYLEASGHNWDRAVHMFFEQHPVTPSRRIRPHPPDVPPRPMAPYTPRAPPAAAPLAGNPPAGQLALPPPLNLVVALPFTVLNVGFGLVFRVLNLGASILTTLARRVLPRPMMLALAGVGRALRDGSRELDPTASAAVFIREFRERYPGGPRQQGEGAASGSGSGRSEGGGAAPLAGIRWEACGWQEAAQRAQAEGKFLLVYLHSSRHQDADDFCRGTLCSPEVCDYINTTLLAWGGDLRHSDAFRLSVSLRAAAYPYIGLLAFSGARTRLVTCVEGKTAASQLLGVLQSAVAANSQLLWQEQMERQQREFDRRLREEQDAEYQRSLEADRQREEAEAAAAREREAAERAQQEAAERERAERDAEERRKAESQAALQRRKEAKAAALPEEPTAGTPGTTLIRIRLPDGANHQRRFRAEDAMQVVYDYADSLPSLTCLKYSLATAFPRRVYGPDTLQQPLSSLDLIPQGVLLLQPEDDE